MVQLDRRAELYLLIAFKQKGIHAIKIKFHKIVDIRLFLMLKKAGMIDR